MEVSEYFIEWCKINKIGYDQFTEKQMKDFAKFYHGRKTEQGKVILGALDGLKDLINRIGEEEKNRIEVGDLVIRRGEERKYRVLGIREVGMPGVCRKQAILDNGERVWLWLLTKVKNGERAIPE